MDYKKLVRVADALRSARRVKDSRRSRRVEDTAEFPAEYASNFDENAQKQLIAEYKKMAKIANDCNFDYDSLDDFVDTTFVNDGKPAFHVYGLNDLDAWIEGLGKFGDAGYEVNVTEDPGDYGDGDAVVYSNLNVAIMDSRKRVKDSEEGTIDVMCGINATLIGKTNEAHDKLWLYEGGHFEDGYAYEDACGDYPTEEEDAAKKYYAEKWGVTPEDVIIGMNDSWEGGYAWVQGTLSSTPVSVDPADFDVDDAGVWFDDAAVRKFNDTNKYPWYAETQDQ